VVQDENTRRNTNAPQCERQEHYSGILADDLALISLSMLDLQPGTKHVRDCFLLFELKIHIGVRGSGKDGKDSESKTVAMLVPKAQDRNNFPQTESYDLDDGTSVPFCTKFKYLGSIIAYDLDDTTELERRLSHTHKWLSIHSGKYSATNVSMSIGGASCTRCAS
jgi:hypothetical protein